ncbi:hypothetical protein QZM42_05370 [Burkholderia vietnamiensis]|uniref:hypothetical protein n=1 Tax=Burkholderia vietnamiensis TaxID=60552 RepID=UPI002653FB84|nr:hypothetical protein [Burkholderia vietnamiensis]MDN7407974.1 hypothetical protein [Burkholderia vietnamiensis]
MAAVIAAGAAVTVAYATNFVAEQYRPHLDSTGWASAIAGELKSHASAFPMVKALFADLLQRVEKKETLPLYPLPMPTDPVFDSAPGKVGLLGAQFAGEVAFAYESLRAFRGAFFVVIDHHKDMDPEQLTLRLTRLQNMIEANETRLWSLIHGLDAYSALGFNQSRFVDWWSRRLSFGQRARSRREQ